jgi:hypothetical protein
MSDISEAQEILAQGKKITPPHRGYQRILQELVSHMLSPGYRNGSYGGTVEPVGVNAAQPYQLHKHEHMYHSRGGIEQSLHISPDTSYHRAKISPLYSHKKVA